MRTFNPKNCVQAMRIAQDVEAKLRGSLMPHISGSVIQWRGGRELDPGSGGKRGVRSNFPSGARSDSGSHYNSGPYKGTFRSGPLSSDPTQTMQSGSNVNPNSSSNSVQKERDEGGRGNNPRNRDIKHLPYSELMDGKVCGLCFQCGERFHPLHQCTEKQFHLVILGNNEVVIAEGEVIAIEVRDDEDEATLDCNIMGVFGLTEGMKTMKRPTTM